MQGSEWFYVQGLEAKGPLTLEQVQQALQKGHLDWHTYFCRQGDDDWTLARDIPDFYLGTAPAPGTQEVDAVGAALEHVGDLEVESGEERIACSHCGHLYPESLTLQMRNKQRICKLCRAQLSAQQQKALERSPRGSWLGPVAAMLVILGIPFSLIGLVRGFDISVPIINETGWARKPAAEWPPILCLNRKEGLDTGTALMGISFIASWRSHEAFVFTSTASLAGDAAPGSLIVSPFQQSLVSDNHAAEGLGVADSSGGVTMLTGETLPDVEVLRIRSFDVGKGARLQLVVPAAEQGETQRTYWGEVSQPGSGTEYGRIVMDEVFPAKWLVGAPLLDANGRVAGMLQGEQAVDLSRVGNRNTLIFVPAERLRSMLRERAGF